MMFKAQNVLIRGVTDTTVQAILAVLFFFIMFGASMQISSPTMYLVGIAVGIILYKRLGQWYYTALAESKS